MTLAEYAKAIRKEAEKSDDEYLKTIAAFPEKMYDMLHGAPMAGVILSLPILGQAITESLHAHLEGVVKRKSGLTENERKLFREVHQILKHAMNDISVILDDGSSCKMTKEEIDRLFKS